MSQLTFHIDKLKSDGSLTINIRTADPTIKLSENKLIQLATGNEKEAVDFLVKEELSYLYRQQGKTVPRLNASFNVAHISYGKSQQALKLLAATGKLYFADRRLICDFFTPVEFSYRVESKQSGEVSISGVIKANNEEFN